ncbi:MAG: Response regulator receiver protein [Candidatus Uhrbacteria bacterium GW2011_GWF2_39_13]|uniref:Response regulator receiver protein n=1 Tax=Candidatus Uhrbacteria bacterium GW2011_GWF2_39_13 TaxID=1618995 RepID=A0A0G0QM56_9BACT|nr:MAG: Response regulator receiver protein [Candidatus Uhrbacteria bacterium GW2011_GWF2_39_13]
MAQILLIEDNDSMRETLTHILERKGYEVITACDGEEGLRIFRSSPTPLVITDIIMPNKEGVETIFELERDFPHVKIIAISGGGKVEAQNYLKAVSLISNVKHTLKKPFSNEELLAAVKDLLA